MVVDKLLVVVDDDVNLLLVMIDGYDRIVTSRVVVDIVLILMAFMVFAPSTCYLLLAFCYLLFDGYTFYGV